MLRLCLVVSRIYPSRSWPEDRTGMMNSVMIQSEVKCIGSGENAVGGAKTMATDLN